MPLRTASLGTLVSCAVLAATARAESFHSDQGFSLNVPDGWQVASDHQRQDAQQRSQELFPKVRNALDSCVVVLVNPVQDDFMENIAVAVVRATIPVNSRSEEEYARQMAEAASARGMPILNVRTERGKAGKYDAIFVRNDLRVGPALAMQWQAVVPGSKQTYVINCCARHSEFAQYEPEFRRTIDSLQIDDEPLAVPAAVRVIAAAFGVLMLLAGIVAVVVILKVSRRVKTAAPAASPGAPQSSP